MTAENDGQSQGAEAPADAMPRVGARHEHFEPSRLADFVTCRYSPGFIGRRISAVYAEVTALGRGHAGR